MKPRPHPCRLRSLAVLATLTTSLVVAPCAHAQVSISYTPTFTATGINMWGTGANPTGAHYFYGASWNASGSVGGIEETIVGDFGARIYGSTSGQVGLNIGVNSTAGHVDVTLPYAVNISTPTNLANAGQHNLTVTQSLTAPAGGSFVRSTFASTGFAVNAQITAQATLGGEIAFFGRTGGSVQVLNTNLNFPVASFTNNVLTFAGVPLDIGPGLSIPLPPPFTVQGLPKLTTIGTLTVAPPALNATSGTGLTTHIAQPSLLSVDLDLLGAAAALGGLPFNPLDISLNIGVAKLTGTTLKASVGVDLGLSQQLTLDPRLGMILRSSSPLTYHTPTGDVVTNAFTVTNLSAPISFTKGAGEVSIFPEFFLTTTLRNDFDLLVGGSYSAQALHYGYSIPGIGSGSIGPIFSYSVDTPSAPIGLVDNTFTVTGSGLNQTQLGRSLTNVAPTVGNIGANQAVAIPGLVGSFSTSSIGGSLRLSAGSLYLNTTPLTVTAPASLVLTGGSGSTANRLTTPGLTNLGLLEVGAGSTVEVTGASGFTNVNASGVLSGGTYKIDGTFNYSGANVTANAAHLTVSGSFLNGTTHALSTLAENSVGASLTLNTALNTGRPFVNYGSLTLNDALIATAFNNDYLGTVDVRAGGTLTLTTANGFQNVHATGNEFVGGQFTIAGSIRYEGANDTPGRSISSIGLATTLVLTGSSTEPRISHWQPDGGMNRDALSTLELNRGNFALTNGARQTLTPAFTNHGALWVSGTGSQLTVENNVTNNPGRVIELNGGRLLVAATPDPTGEYDPIARNFTNQGTLTLLNGGRLDVSGLLGNFSNFDGDYATATFSGGTWNLGGDVHYGTSQGPSPNIREIGSGTVLNLLGGTLFNDSRNTSAFVALAINRGTLLVDGLTIRTTEPLTNTGSLTVNRPSGLLGFANSLTNTGTITVGPGATLSTLGSLTFSDAANWSNVNASGLLSGLGNVTLAGTLDYKGTPITGLAAGSALTLSGSQWRFSRRTGSSSSVTGLGLTSLGGTLNLVDQAQFQAPAATTFTLQSTGRLTTSATSGFIVPAGSTFLAAGGASIVNDGVILLSHNGTSPAQFGVSGNVTLAGTGSVQLTNFANNAFLDSGGLLTNAAGHTLAGAGLLGAKLINRGLIQSIGSAGLTLTHSSGANVTNSGLILASGSLTYPTTAGVTNYGAPTYTPSLLTISNLTLTNFEGATAGRISSNGLLRIGNATIAGGLVDVRAGGLLTLDRATLHSGEFWIAPQGRVEIAGGTTTLSGTSLGTADGSTLTLLDTGNVLSPAVLTVNGAQPFNNFADVYLRNASRIEGTAPFLNSGALLVHQPALTAPAVIGTNFRNTPDGLIDIDQTSSLRWVGDAYNAGRVQVGHSGVAGAGTLSFPVNTTLTGGGTLQIGGIVATTLGGVTTHQAVASGRLTAPDATAPTLTNVDNLIRGAGTIGDTRLGLVNQTGGTVHASASGATLLLNPGPAGLTNHGLLKSDADTRLEISTASGPFTNYSSATTTLTGGRYESAGIIAFTGADIRTNAADLTLIASGQFLNATTGADALAHFATNAASGTFRLQSGATFTSTVAFTNHGALVLTGSTFATPSLAGTGTVHLADAAARLSLNAASGSTASNNVLSGPGQLLKPGASTATLSGASTFTGGTTLFAGTLALGHDSALGTGPVTFAGGTLQGDGTARTIGNRLSLSSDGTIAGASALTFTGKLTTSVTPTHTLTVSNSAPTTFGAIDLSNNATSRSLTFAGTGNVTVTGLIADGSTSTAGSLTKTGPGTLTLSAANTYGGGTTLDGGTLIHELASGYGTGPLTLVSGTLSSGFINYTLYNPVHLAGDVTLANGLALLGSITLTGHRSLTVPTNARLGGAIAQSGGTFGLTKDGAGTLFLSGANTYTGPTTVAAGILRLERTAGPALAGPLVINGGATAVIDAANQVSDTAAIAINGGTLVLNGTSELIASAGLFLTGGLAEAYAGGSLQFASGAGVTTHASSSTASITAPLTLIAGAPHVFTVADGPAATDLRISGALSPSGGASTFVKSGPGLLSLTGNNSSTGGTVVAAGTLALGHANALGTGGLTFQGGQLRTDVPVTFHSPVTLSSFATVNTNSQSLTLGGLIAGGGGLIKTGAGPLTLSATNTYAGTTFVLAGTLVLSAPNALAGPLSIDSGALVRSTVSNTLADFSAPITVSGGTLQFENGATEPHQSTITMTGGTIATLGSGQLLINQSFTTNASTSTAVLSARTALYPGASFNVAAGPSPGGIDLDLTGGLSEGAVTALVKNGSGQLRLSGTNTYSGGTTLNAGTLLLGSSHALPDTGTLTVGAAGTLKLNNYSDTVGGLTGSGSIQLGTGGTLALGAGNLSGGYTGAISGSGAIRKIGTGTLALGGASTYSGTTSLEAGALRLANATGSAFGTSAVAVASPATLTGHGAFTGSLALSGTLAPGNSAGTILAGATTFLSGGRYQWEINDGTGLAGVNWDRLSVTGVLTIASTSASPFTINLASLTTANLPGDVINFNSSANYAYTIATATSGISGFSTDKFTLNAAGFTNHETGTWSLAQNGPNLDLLYTASAIPEPSTYAALAGLATLAIAVLRRRSPPPA